MRYKTRKPSSCWGHKESGTQSGKQREENRKYFKQIAKDSWIILYTCWREKVNINLLYDDDIQTIDVDGKKIIAIKVPRADYTVRPVYINNNL